jgi:outer membrane protein TolC
MIWRIVTTLSVLAAVSAKAEVLTLDQAVALAVEHNRTLRNTALDVKKAEDRVKATRSRQYPGFNLYALGSQQLQAYDFTLEKGILGTYPGTGPLPDHDVHLKSPLAPTGLMMAKVTQPLTSLIRLRRNIDSLKTSAELSSEQLREDRLKVIRDVKQVYYALQQVDSSLRSVAQTMALYRELQRLTENYVAGAVVLKAELLDVQARVAKTAQTELVLRDQMTGGKEQLNQLLGREISADFEVQPILESAGGDLDLQAAREVAVRQRPEVRQAQLRKQQATQDWKAKRAEFIPDIAAEFNNVTLLNYGNFLPVQNSSVGLSLTWEVFDWGRKKHESEEKRRTIDQAGNAEKEAVNAVLVDVGSKYRQLRQSRSQLDVARLVQETAVESLRVTKNKYAVQAVLFRDVLQGQVNLEQSNTDYQQALLTFWNARADFERALGEEQ